MDNLYVQQLSVSFDGFKALDIDIFEVAQNELRVVIGPNGAGKTTLLDVLCGRARPDVGHAYFKDQDLTKLSEDEIVDLRGGAQVPSADGFYFADRCRQPDARCEGQSRRLRLAVLSAQSG